MPYEAASYVPTWGMEYALRGWEKCTHLGYGECLARHVVMCSIVVASVPCETMKDVPTWGTENAFRGSCERPFCSMYEHAV